ncbi:hypothetical protein [Rhodoferax fermentans]|uniref:Uncharacterized protein n=1 Tax=Rhodoferax fermentans TaxID=28066 RepID=A0A1T1ANQ1_RHOFE|nr:hypothetical protein [Rhodoferax fermentans]OOV05761.1 hypothetical protein RF819_02715 [Rhodoferax fermentans]
MSILATFTKQPSEAKFFDVHFEDFLADLETDVVGAPDVTVGTGVFSDGTSSTVAMTQKEIATIVDGVVRVWSVGGEHLAKYKYTIKVTCANGWIEEQEICVKVKET